MRAWFGGAGDVRAGDVRVGVVAAALLCAACRGDEAPPGSPPPAGHTGAETGGTPEPTRTTGALAATGHTGAPWAVRVPPALALVGDAAPLTAVLTLEVDRAASLVLHLDDGERSWSYPVPGAPSAVVDAPVVGGRAGRTVAVQAELTDAAGDVFSVDAGAIALPPLPFPLTVDLAAADPARMEPGYTLFPVGDHLGLFDAGGEPVWLLKTQGSVHEVLPAEPGSMAYRILSDKTDLVVVDVRGRLVKGWYPERLVDRQGMQPVDVLALHHDVQRLPDGSYLGLSVERRMLEYPVSEADPTRMETQWVAGDVVVNFAEDGAVLHSWPLLDRLDPDRIGYDAVQGVYWNDFRPFQPEGARDWSHGNAVSYDPATDRVIVGLRHQDAVVALERSSGDVAWVLAPPESWSAPYADRVLAADGVGTLPYHMHGAKWTDTGTLLLFDNGNWRATPPDAPVSDFVNASRAVEYDIDPVAGTFRERWSYTSPEGLFVGSLGDADRMPTTDNVLITWGNIKNTDARGAVRVQEVTRAGETVFDLWLPGGTIFRAERVPGLLP